VTKKVSAIIVAAWHYASFSLFRQAEAVGAEHFHCRFRALRWKSYVRRRPLLLARVDERPCFFLPLQRRRFGIARTARAARPAAAGQAPVRVRLLFPGERERERERERKRAKEGYAVGRPREAWLRPDYASCAFFVGGQLRSRSLYRPLTSHWR